MCVAVPGRVVALHDQRGMPTATVDMNGTVREGVSLALLPDVRVGDYVVVHLGMALDRLDEQTAADMLADLERCAPRSPGA